MARIKTIATEEAKSDLKDLYEAAVKRAGHVFNIISLQSLNPPVLKASTDLYQAIMLGPSSLSREEREMIAVVVSKAMGCFY
jgi:uncharacterized peroxidase-related enzyme